MNTQITLSPDELAYLRALVDAESDLDEESRHLSEECSDERDAVQAKLHNWPQPDKAAQDRAYQGMDPKFTAALEKLTP